MTDHGSDLLDLGACCACGRSDSLVRNVVMLEQRASVPGTGWGCLLCNLPPMAHWQSCAISASPRIARRFLPCSVSSRTTNASGLAN